MGMFGIGGFANFGVCDRLVVTSKDDKSSGNGTATSLSAEGIATRRHGHPQGGHRRSRTRRTHAEPLVVGELMKAPDVEESESVPERFRSIRANRRSLQWKVHLS